MDAGKLSRRIRIERATASQDDLGQPVEEWAEIARVWVTDPKPAPGVVIAGDRERVQNRLTYLVRREAGDRIEPQTDRVIDGNLTARVVDVVPKDRHLSVLAVESTA